MKYLFFIFVLGVLLALQGVVGAAELEATPSDASQVINGAGAGDTVLLADGEYNMNLWISAGGSSGNYLTIKAAEGALPIIKGSSGSTCVDLSASWVRVEGLVAQGCATGFANKWGGGNGNVEFKYNIADNQGRNGISFYSDSNVLIEGNIVSHVGYNEGWSSGVNLYGARGTVLIRRNVSFENIDNSGNGTDGSGFIADESSQGVVFENNIGFRNGGSCIRMTNSSCTEVIYFS